MGFTKFKSQMSKVKSEIQNSKLRISDRRFLLNLARKAIEYFLETGKILEIEEVPEELRKERACFVTLTKNEELRGCIGDIEAYQPLYKDVIKNAIAAAFYDCRFEPVGKGELKDLEIEISVLNQPSRETPCEAGEIKKGDGVVLEKDGRRAVFLPQVWEELPKKEEFLRHLALKAGLEQDAWKDAPLRQGFAGQAKYKIFGVEIIK